MFDRKAARLLLLGLVLTTAPVVAQSPADSGGAQVWGSVGLGLGNVSSPVARAAVSVAVNPVVMFTAAATSYGYIDETASSAYLLAGIKTTDPRQLFFLSA